MEKLKLKEKIGYGFGDFASSMFWKMFSVYLLFFYTDVFGISAAVVGTMFLITRVFDGLNDPIMGILADRTNTKWGKFRPYLVWMAIPFAIFGVLTFTTPELSLSSKIVYAYVTYCLMMIVYTSVNVPYASLLGVMTSNLKDRTSLASYRFIFAFAGSILVLATAEPLVDFLGREGDIVNAQKGWQSTMAIYAVIAAILFYGTFAWTRERVQPPKEQKTALGADLKNLAKNAPWFILLGAGICTLIFNSIRDGSTIYYFKYYFDSQSALQLPVLNVPFAMLMACLLSCIFFIFKANDLFFIFLFQFLISICAGIVFPLLWSMYADIADYSEWKTGRRATGLIFSSSSMSQKMGWTLGGALTGWILAYYGFEANMEQSEDAKTGIRMMMSILPAIGAFLSALFIIFYKLNDKYMVQINQELVERRKH